MLPERNQILVVNDEPNLRRVLSALLVRDDYDVHTAEDGEQALAVLNEHHIDMVVTDLRMPKMDGMELLRRVRAMDEELPVVIITAHGTVNNAVEALKTGAFDYITKPFDQTEVRTIVKKALRTRDLAAAEATRQTESVVSEETRFGIIGTSGAIKDLYAVIERVADTPTTVLVTGESGTGKELVARALHENSSRRDKPFIRVNCAAIPRDLMESELFGYERGAFTGAVGSKPGRFELAHGGTLFLDEIGTIPTEMQVKLLRSLQESEFERVGGIKTIRVDVRLVAATNSDLRREIETGSFQGRSVLSTQRSTNSPIAVARASRGHTIACAALPFEVQQPSQQEYLRNRRRRGSGIGKLPLAGKHPGIGKRNRACCIVCGHTANSTRRLVS